jgi:UDP-GlcNAc:undecaprenyl-phosphate GlcNAc-1-phosphate transferase
MTLELWQKTLLMVLITYLFVYFITPIIKKIAFHIGAVDLPDERKVHIVIMPRLGGIAIFLGFLLGYMIFGEPNTTMNSILIAGIAIVLTGLVDDVKPLRARYKLIGQIVAALIIVFYGNLLIKDVDAFNIYISFGLLSYPITIFFIVGAINCINLIDGLDGLAAGISSIFYLTIGIIAIMQNKFGLDYVLTFIMLGSTLGFLAHNFNPATIFMGDSGSMFLGFIIAVISLLGFKNITVTSLFIPVLVLAIPIFDTLFAILRRLLKGEKISSPDKFHIHHQLLNKNFSQRTTVLIIYLIDAIFAFASIVYILNDKILGYIVYSLLLLIIVIFVATTNVIFNHDDVRKK